MGFLTDLFKEVPLSAVLKEKVAVLEDKYASLETELAIKKDDLRAAKSENQKLQAEIVKLKEEIDRLTHKDVLDETAEKILALIPKLHKHPYAEEFAVHLGLHIERVTYYLSRLEKAGYVRGIQLPIAGPTPYRLTDKGRVHLMDKGVI